MKNTFRLSLMLSTGMVGYGTSAYGQDAVATPPASSPSALTQTAVAEPANGLGDIVVVARRRAENLQSVPVAVTAVTGTQLQDRNITTTLDLAKVSPGLNAQPSGGVSRNLPLYSIRGQQQGEFLASSDPSVGIYWGDQLIQRAYGSDLNMFDLSQVEVLKGPQGTLFGRNTTGGNIIFRPNTPTDRLEGGAYLQTGSYRLVNAQAYVNFPIADGIALRLAANYKYQDGYINNVYDGVVSKGVIGQTDGKYYLPTFQVVPGMRDKMGGERGAGLRASLKIDEGRFHSLTVGTYTTRNTEGSGYRLYAINPQSGAAALIGTLGPAAAAEVERDMSLPWNEVSNARQSYTKMPYSWAVSNTTSFDLTDDIKIKNIAGYHSYKASNYEDIAGTALPLLNYGTALRGWELSDEIQLAGDMPGLNWIAGAYYYREKAQENAIGAQTLGFFVPATPTGGIEQDRNNSKSLFASVTKKLWGGLSLTVGGRYTWDQRAVTFGQFNDVSQANQACALSANSGSYTLYHAVYDPVRCTMDMSKKFHAFTYTTSLDWKLTPHQLIYVAHRKGYRAGGFNTRATQPPSDNGAPGYGIFKPEVVRDIEFGLKSDFRVTSDVSLRTNIAAYYQWYKNIQRLLTYQTPDGTAQTVVQNAANATIYGGEFESTLAIGKWLNLHASYALVKPKYKSFVFQGVDYAGSAQFGGVVRNQVSAGGTVTLPTPESFAVTKISADYYYQSSFYNQNDIFSYAQAKVPAYHVTNLRLEFANIGGSRVTAGVSVNNVMDRHYLINNYSLYGSNSIGFSSVQYAMPRTWNADLRFAF